LFLEQAKGYVKALEKSTSPLSTMREVFEYGMRSLVLMTPVTPRPRRHWMRIGPQAFLCFSRVLL
jgi:hypothetical protein